MAFVSGCGLDLDHPARQRVFLAPSASVPCGSGSRLEQGTDLELSEDQGKSCSTGIGVKGDSSAVLYFPACLRAAHIQCQ